MAQVGGEKDPAELLLLDTNILIIYAREGEPSRRLLSLLRWHGGPVDELISVVSVGEALAFARKNGWGERRQAKLREMFRSRVVPVDINRQEILEAYARIDYHNEKVQSPARPMGKNDIWIAATAHVLDCELVTTDKDFDHLHGVMLRRRWIDPLSLRGEQS